MCFRYGLNPLNLPASCNSCRKKTTIKHTTACKKGGNVIQQHDKIKQTFEDLMAKAMDPKHIRDEASIQLHSECPTSSAASADLSSNLSSFSEEQGVFSRTGIPSELERHNLWLQDYSPRFEDICEQNFRQSPCGTQIGEEKTISAGLPRPAVFFLFHSLCPPMTYLERKQKQLWNSWLAYFLKSGTNPIHRSVVLSASNWELR